MKRKRTLAERYPSSEPCACDVCLAYCRRPGWWTVAEAAAAVEAGYGHRMMLELAPDRSFGVVSPAFAGNEQEFALQRHAALERDWRTPAGQAFVQCWAGRSDCGIGGG